MRKVLILAGLALLTMAGAASAKVTLYDCTFAQSRARGGGWVPERLVITDDDKTGEIIVYDPIIKHFIGKPISARRSAETKVRVTFVWDLDARVQGQSPRMTYTMSYFRNGLAAKVRVQPGGYDNTWDGEGKCTVGTR